MKKYDYDLNGDILSYCVAKGIGVEEFCALADISRPSLNEAMKGGAGSDILEKAYGTIYRNNFLLNKAKDELFHDEYGTDTCLLYHGSKYGIDEISPSKSRANCDLGTGFYTSTSYSSAASFITSFPVSSVYLFGLNLAGLKVMNLQTDDKWMLLIAYFRGYLERYKDSPKLKTLLDEVGEQDVIIAPIANNKMFQVLDEFATGLINDQQAKYCLSASRLGYQYVLKTQKAIDGLTFLNRYYLVREEKEHYLNDIKDHAALIQSKLFLAKRKYRNDGRYIDELL